MHQAYRTIAIQSPQQSYHAAVEWLNGLPGGMYACPDGQSRRMVCVRQFAIDGNHVLALVDLDPSEAEQALEEIAARQAMMIGIGDAEQDRLRREWRVRFDQLLIGHEVMRPSLNPPEQTNDATLQIDS